MVWKEKIGFILNRGVVLASTKAQVKFFETIGVLIIFFMLLVISFVFYMNYQKGQFRIQQEQKAVLASTEMASKSFLMPEFDCSILGAKVPNCYDKFKLRAFEALVKDSEAVRTNYFSIFGFATINITNVQPGGEYFTVYDSRPLGKEPKRNIYRTTSCLLDPISGACSFGVVEVTTYVERE